LDNKIAAGELPSAGGAINIVKEGTACSPGQCVNEGRWMMEIIYDTAPNAKLYFASAMGGTVSHANAISSLAAQGVDVIADDVIYVSEPWFQGGTVYNAVGALPNTVLYVISGGNFGSQSIQQKFKVRSFL